LDYQIDKIEKNKITITHNKTQKNKNINFQILLVQYGQKVNHDLLKLFNNLKTNEQNRIHVDINQMTSIQNIYAIGNVCIYKDKPSSIICAHGEAAVAIRSILNDVKNYDK
jgi:thioredoxin reductase (NADPH)